MNGFFLVAGLLVTLLSIAHATWGERRVFNVLTPNITNAETYLSVYVPWHQLTGVLLLSGVALVLAAFQSKLAFVPAANIAPAGSAASAMRSQRALVTGSLS